MSALYMNVSGQLVLQDKSGLSISNRAFKYGDGLFETIRIKNGKPLFLNDHYNRLLRGMEVLKMNPPSNFSEADILNEIQRIVKQNEIDKGGRVRLNVFRNAAGFYTPVSDNAAWVMEAKPIDDNAFTLNKEGLNIGIYRERKLMPNYLSGIKSTSCLPYVLAGIYGREKGWDDCLLENTDGNLIEAVSSNLFLMMGNTFYTPPLTDGCLPGVMRKQLIQLIRDLGGNVIENSIRASHLERVEEVFLTNSVRGIQWIGAYNQKRYFHTQCDELVKALNRLTD